MKKTLQQNAKFFDKLPKIRIRRDLYDSLDVSGFELEDITCSHRINTQRYEEDKKNGKPKYIIRVFEEDKKTSEISSLNRIFAYKITHGFRKAIRMHYALIEYFKSRGQ